MSGPAIELCASLQAHAISALRSIGSRLNIENVQAKSKRQLCEEIGQILNVVIDNIKTIQDRHDFESGIGHDYIDHISKELLFEPVLGADDKWYNKSTYLELIKNNSQNRSLYFRSPYTRALIMSMTIPPIDQEKQNEVFTFITEHGLDIPVQEEIDVRIIEGSISTVKLGNCPTVIESIPLSDTYTNEGVLPILNAMGFKVFDDYPWDMVVEDAPYIFVKTGDNDEVVLIKTNRTKSFMMHFQPADHSNDWPWWLIEGESYDRMFRSKSLETLCAYRAYRT